jgi:putative ABC transport system permease protein
LKFMTSASMGIEKENLLIVKRPDVLGFQIESFKEQVLQIPGVEKVANATAVPGKLYSNNAFMIDEDPTKTTHLIMQDQISFGYPETMGIKLSSGRFFSKEFGTDTLAILINETAVKSLGLTDPLGKYLLQPSGPGKFVKRRIVGVMKDFNIESLHKKISPVCLTLMPGNYPGFLCLRLNGNNIQETIKTVEKTWKDYSKNQPFQYSFFADDFNKLYETENKAGRIFILFSILAILIACLGLIGLITFMTSIRTREIGIRKTFGASKISVVSLISKEIIILILISSLLAYPAAYYGVKIWLEGFAEKVNVSPLIYLSASIIGLAIGLFAIIYQTLKAANHSPAEALRYK